MKREVKEIRRLLRQFASERGASKSFCPSEVARALDGEAWRERMPAVRAEAATLIAAGELCCTQRGETVDPLAAHGPIRLARVGSAATENAAGTDTPGS